MSTWNMPPGVTTNDIPGQDDDGGEPVSAAYELRPAAWIDNSGHPHHLSYIQGVVERRLRGGLEPLYDGQTLWNAVATAGLIEREKIKGRLLEMHEAHKHRHNYYACAVVELFEPERLEPAAKLHELVRQRQAEAALQQAREALQATMGAWGGTCAWHADVKAAIAAIDALGPNAQAQARLEAKP